MKIHKQIEIREHNAPIYSVVGEGFDIYTSSGDKFVVRWNLRDGTQEPFSIKMDFASYCLVYHNSILFIGSSKGELYVVVPSEKKILAQRKVAENAIHALLVSKQHIIVGTADGKLLFLDKNTLATLKEMPFNCGKIRAIQPLDEQRIVLATQDGYIRILLTETFEIEHQFSGHEKGVNKTLVFDNKLFTVGKDGYLRIWNWQEETQLNALPIHYETIYDIQQVGAYIVTASRDKSIKIWQYNGALTLVQKLMSKQLGHSHSVNALHVIDDKNFCSVSDDKRIIWWTMEDEEINLLHLLTEQ
ncbi:MAG TPA: hypothetical protein PLP27_12850 [Crocinitomicaceae bacterium]|nr:hypothetical protein [Crocinitomicaceae bacterium]